MTEDSALAAIAADGKLATLPLSNTEIVRFEDPQFPWLLTLDFDPDKMPKSLREEIKSLNDYTEYLLRQLHANALAKQQWADKFKKWRDRSTKYGPEDLIGDQNWERYYAAVVLSDEPLLGASPLATADERDPLEQRILATELLTGTATKAKERALKERAATLLCSRNPRDSEFFNERTLEECLKKEKLTTNTAINRALGRGLSTYVKASNKREALWAAWQERDEVLVKEYRLQTGDWEDSETEMLQAFTCFAWTEITRDQLGGWCPNLGIAVQTQVGLWSVAKQIYDEYDIDDYLLDPRDEDTWVGIRDFARALKAKSDEYEQWHSDFQEGVYTAQRWMKEEGLKALYGNSADWWADEPDLSQKEGDDLLLWINSILRPEMFGEFRDAISLKYYTRLQEALTNA